MKYSIFLFLIWFVACYRIFFTSSPTERFFNDTIIKYWESDNFFIFFFFFCVHSQTFSLYFSRRIRKISTWIRFFALFFAQSSRNSTKLLHSDQICSARKKRGNFRLSETPANDVVNVRACYSHCSESVLALVTAKAFFFIHIFPIH